RRVLPGRSHLGAAERLRSAAPARTGRPPGAAPAAWPAVSPQDVAGAVRRRGRPFAAPGRAEPESDQRPELGRLSEPGWRDRQETRGEEQTPGEPAAACDRSCRATGAQAAAGSDRR